MATDDSNPRWSNRDQSLTRAVTELLESGEYERLAELLDRVRVAREEQGDALPAHTLDLARRICLACSQSQAEVEWHQQACEEAAQREDRLRQQLDMLLELAGAQQLSIAPMEGYLSPDTSTGMLGPPAPATPELVEAPSLWQRIQGILHGRLGSQPLEAVFSEAPVQGSTLPPLGWAEDRAPSPTEEAEAPLHSPAQIPHAQPPSPLQATAAADSFLPGTKREAGTVPLTGSEKPEEPGPPSLVVYCLGPFRVYQDDHLITDWESLKARCILKYLVAQHGTPIVKDALMDAFWPDAEPEAARRNLHQAVYSLRKTLRHRRPDFPYVCFESDCYLLNPDTSAWLDFEQFEQQYRDGQRLEAAGQLAEAIEKYGIAEGLYQGDFLEEDLYEDWPTPQRQHFRTLYLQMADRLSEYYVRHGDLAAAIVLCRKILSLDSCYEEAHCRLMRCYLTQGQRHLAVRQYQICEQALREELDLAPSEEIVTLYSQLTITA